VVILSCLWIRKNRSGDSENRSVLSAWSLNLFILVHSFISESTARLGTSATLERFFWHISGKQFRVWMFSGWSVVQKQSSYFVNNFTSEFIL